MANGKPQQKGKVHAVFVDRLENLRTQSEAAGRAALGNTGVHRQWHRPDAEGWDGDPLAIEDLKIPFDREEINANYSELIDDAAAPGTVGDVVGVKTQCDYVAAMERAYRARQTTAIRAIALAAGRRAGHGHEAGIFTDASGPLKYVADSIRAGQNTEGIKFESPAADESSVISG